MMHMGAEINYIIAKFPDIFVPKSRIVLWKSSLTFFNFRNTIFFFVWEVFFLTLVRVNDPVA